MSDHTDRTTSPPGGTSSRPSNGWVTIQLSDGRETVAKLPHSSHPLPIVYEERGEPETITESLKHAMWSPSKRCYVERPGHLVKAELIERFTPRQIRAARGGSGCRSELRGGCYWSVPHRAWEPPKPGPVTHVHVLDGGEVRRYSTETQFCGAQPENWHRYYRRTA